MKKLRVIKYLKNCFDVGRSLTTVETVLRDIEGITYEELRVILLELQEHEMLACRYYDNKICVVSLFVKIRDYKRIYAMEIKDIMK